jgi:hypothetical protein
MKIARVKYGGSKNLSMVLKVYCGLNENTKLWSGYFVACPSVIGHKTKQRLGWGNHQQGRKLFMVEVKK